VRALKTVNTFGKTVIKPLFCAVYIKSLYLLIHMYLRKIRYLGSPGRCRRVKTKHSLWRGFTFEPQGTLLNQHIDLNGPMGVAYERSHSYYKDFHTHDRHILVFPRASCAMEVRIRPGTESHRIHSADFLIVPSHVEHDDEGMSPIYDTFALLPSDEFIGQVGKKRGVEKPPNNFFSQTRLLVRSEWLNRLIEEYFFEKVIANRLGEDSLRFFEEHILIEIFRIASGSKRSKETSTPSENLDHSASDPVVARALRFIEGNLFDELSLKVIAAKSFASESTLQRRFRNALGLTPIDYIRTRRLDEAANLLKKGTHSVTEVAAIVGYSNLGAFSEAFKIKFGKSPSAVYKKDE
jgi:AraC-like DNA-binding protein